MLKLCKNCKHFENDSFISLDHGKCKLTRKVVPGTINTVSGLLIAPKDKFDFASMTRASDGECKEIGLLYTYEKNIYKRFWNCRGGYVVFVLQYVMVISMFVAWYALLLHS